MKAELTQHSIVIVDNDLELTHLYHKYLSKRGFSVTVLDNGLDNKRDVVEQIVDQHPSMVIVDSKCVDIDGIEVYLRIRESYPNLILMLSAETNAQSIIMRLEAGADNCLTKPIIPQLLLAHIQALLRRYESSSKKSKEYRIQNLKINLQSYTLYKNDQPIFLTNGEFEILAILVEEAGSLVTRDSLYQKIHGIEYEDTNRSLDVRISTLRRKLQGVDQSCRYIKTVRGKGYILVE